ncbi:MAG: 16S rRNA (guanine(527)-N(7))-methyltransferase RsmG [Bacillus subtilis]|nr:16S rRNA (guanine(527)-N(7))-methyltransferase RsmG [Bacillus subtilis]
MFAWFFDALKEMNLSLSDVQIRQFETYSAFLLETNKQMNLTAITEVEEVYRKHFLDSLALSRLPGLKAQTLLDVGSGAGFPSIPLKICFPELKITIIDSLQKRIGFLTTLVDKLNLADVELIHIRAEDFVRRHAFDIVTARAVAHLNVLCEWCIPFARVGGSFVAMKALGAESEIAAAKPAILLLGGSLREAIVYDIGAGERHQLIVIDKVKGTPNGYPRPYSKIKSKPL